MILIDRVLSWSIDTISCSATNHTHLDNPLRRNGQLPIFAGIEYAGQAIGIHASLSSAKPLESGVLASLREVFWHRNRLCDVHGDLLIEAKYELGGRGGARYQFSIIADNQLALEGRATVAFMS